MSCFSQINRLDRAQAEGRRVQIRMSARQVEKNVSYAGGFLGMLASLAARAIPLAARALPTILSGLATGLLFGGINTVISGSCCVVGDGLYLHKHDKCYRVQKFNGNGLYLAPHPRFVEGDELFQKHGNISVMVLVCSSERIVRLRIFPLWDGYCNYLSRRDVYKSKVLCLSSLSLTFVVEQYG